MSPLPFRPLGIYLHVPFCAARCGYCDFNTYLPESPSAPSGYVEAALAEIRLARAQLGPRRVGTVFFGGGTPTLLGPAALNRLLAGVAEAFELAPDAEVTTEANPESIDLAGLRELRAGGFTRVSVGMQSAVPHVLATLDRVHTAGRAVETARAAREAGFEHVSLDLIYGTPGESDADWETSLTAALSAEPDHISAYALTIEPGTALAARIRRGTLTAPDDAAQARRFTMAEDHLEAAGLHWYEISNWSRDDAGRCHHNLGYWRSDDWWGIGPGAHSHLGGVRWWNVLRPQAYAQALAEGRSPAAGSETLTAEQRDLERVMLDLRTREGLALGDLDDAGRVAVQRERAAGRLGLNATGDRVVLTREGRLFADAVIRELSA